MESSARLDYVLFQLTPTRTRCDLVIFAGKWNEKLAHGLLEPFLSHLRSAKDQIAKGGYSITLKPPPTTSNATWFTKATLQRFVRFVSTPEVLERFVTIEREIEQIENSIRSYEGSNGDGVKESEGNVTAADGNLKYSTASSKPKGECNGTTDAVQQESSRLRLQRILETRKAVLRKEQAMVFARALAAGFEMDNLDDLLSFSDSFGASRLREACLNFMDLCKKKNEDRLWRNEIAAMQACPQTEFAYAGTSGIVLAGEANNPTQNFMTTAHSGSVSTGKPYSATDASLSDSTTSHGSSEINPDNYFPTSAQMPSTDGKSQIPIPWTNVPQYLHNYQGAVYQQMPPYQGYVFPGMPYFPGNMQWRPNVEDAVSGIDREPGGHTNYRSSSKKKDRAFRRRGPENEEQNEYTEPSDSSSENDSSTERRHRKKYGEKSSKTVVIRNINYIASRRDGEKADATEEYSSDENGYLDCDSLKQQVEEAVESLEKHNRSTSHHRKRSGIKQLVSRDSLNGSCDKDNDNEPMKNTEEKKGNGQWDALQQLLMREESEANDAEHHSVPVEEEYFVTKGSEGRNSFAFELEAEKMRKQKPISTDAFLVTKKDSSNDGNVGKTSFENFESGENIRSMTKKHSSPEEFLFSQRNEETECFSWVKPSDYTDGSSQIKSQGCDDWINNGSDEAANGKASIDLGIIDGEYLSSSAAQTETKNKAFMDDSLMVQARFTDDHFDSQLRSDISLVSDILGASLAENGTPENNLGSVGLYEPNDLCMVLDRGTEVEPKVAPWTPAIDFENNLSSKADKMHPNADACIDQIPVSDSKGKNSKKSGASDAKASSKDARPPVGKSKPEIISRNRKPSPGSGAMVHKSKLGKEEENRKKMEELMLQRQKRILERSAVTGHPGRTPKKTQNKAVSSSIRAEKPKTQAASTEETTKGPKSVFRNSTIERLAAAKTTRNISMTQVMKSGQHKKENSMANGVNVSSRLQKTAGVEDKKLNPKKIKPSDKKTGSDNVNGTILSVSNVEKENNSKDDTAALTSGLPTTQGIHASDNVYVSEDLKELQVTSSVSNTLDLKECGGNSCNGDSVNHSDDQYVKIENPGIPEASVVLPKDGKNCSQLASDLNLQSITESANDDIDDAFDVKEKSAANENKPGSPEISEIEDSTTPPTNEMSADLIYTRKKWSTVENSPKATKGFRKLLMFGRKS
ncbi:hypothetical protein Nepgr_007497 [Nepenthes gracilis]|uniref:COP1-interacting protein 7 n=1 Tax=Nepenthes gracilis TaxID=150966 RepID=A0AAD3S7X8_NEPGR|nr:hypothetical protein Nepgr_007497 [Nepenthes gracilis]